MGGWSTATRVRTAWVVLVLAVGIIFTAGIPRSLHIAFRLHVVTWAELYLMGIPIGFPATYLIVIDSLAFVTLAAVGTILVWQRPTERVAVLSGVTLLLTGLIYTAPAYEAPLPAVLFALFCTVAEVAQFSLLYSFPTGSVRPRRLVWLLLPLALWRFYSWYSLYLPRLRGAARTGEQYPDFIGHHPTSVVLLMAVFLAGLAYQAYRYRTIYSAEQRQQTKWLLWATAGALAAIGGWMILMLTVFSHVEVGATAVLLQMAGRTVRHLSLGLIPLAMMYSVLRYHLWELDRLVSRTVSYTLLTALLTALFLGAVVAVQAVVAPVFKWQSPLAVAISTAVTLTLARPLHRRIQTGIERRFNRTRHNAEQNIRTLHSALRDQIEPDQLARAVLGVVQITWQPDHVALWVPGLPAEADADTVYAIGE